MTIGSTKWMLAFVTCVVGALIVFYYSKKYNMTPRQVIVLTVPTIVVAHWGGVFYSYLENGTWAGTRTLGSLLFVPPVMCFISRLAKIPCWKGLDLYAICVYIGIAIMKVGCIVIGCCGGIALWHDSQNNVVYFPSAIVETVVLFSLSLLLLFMQRIPKCRGKLCGIGLIVFCGTRIPLELLRLTQIHFSWGGYSTYTGCVIGILMGIFICWYMGKYHPNPEM